MYSAFVVEDELTVREGIRENVPWDTAGFTLAGEAPDGEIALPLIEELRPDVVLTDIRMPFMDGLELSRILRRLLPSTRIVILSGYEEFDYARQAIDIEVSDYLLKPVGAEKLTEVLLAIKDDLDREEAERSDRLHLLEIKRDAVALMRERFLNDLATGLIGSADAIEYGRRVGLDLVHRYYCVAIVRMEASDASPHNGHYDLFRAGQGVVQELVSDSDQECAFRRSPNDAVVVFMGDEPAEVEQRCSQLCNTIRIELEARTGLTATVSTGTAQERVGSIAASLSRAETALRFDYIFGRSTVIDYRDAERANFRGDVTRRFSTHRIVEALRTARKRELAALVEEYVEQLDDAVLSPVLDAHAFADLVLAMCEFVEELGGVSSDILPGLESVDSVATMSADRASQSAYLVSMAEAAADFRESRRSNKYGETILRAQEFIADRFADPDMSLAVVADHAGISPSHFSTVFSQATGKTFIQYLTDVRITTAKRLLKTTNQRSSEIAYLAGYKDPHYFSYVFKKQTGQTPSDFRNEDGEP